MGKVFSISGGFGSGIEKKLGSGRVRDGRVERLKYSIVYIQVPYLLSGISGLVGYFWVLRVFRVDPKYGVLLDFRVTGYPMIFQTVLGRVSKKCLQQQRNKDKNSPH